jgi:iron complex outermembrane receptor protein
MNKLFLLILSINILYTVSYSQVNYEIKGSILDESNEPLAGASVLLLSENIATITDSKGNFTIGNLAQGLYDIEISFVGYKTVIESISVPENKEYVYSLEVDAISLDEVLVSDSYSEMRKKEQSLNVEIVNDDYLKQNMGGSLMNSLERLPGVSAISIGSGQSKPVIRGLGFNRVAVVENNIKHEAQQWGADHGLEIDQYSVENVEVIKGPASLMYGSDAIGGVINISKRTIPAQNTFGGTIDLSSKSNNDFIGTSWSLFGRRKRFFAELRVSLLDYGDYRVPVDSIDIYSYRAALHENFMRNTAGEEQNMYLTFGYVQKRFESKFYISDIRNKNGFFANAHGLEPRQVDTLLHDFSNRDIIFPYQNVNHFKTINSNTYRWDRSKIELNLGFQRNFRQEWSDYVQHGYMPAIFPDSLNFNPELERQFEKYVYSGNLRYQHYLNDKTRISIGVNGEYQENEIDGRGFIIPEFKQYKAGFYTFSKHSFSDISHVQAGIRYDFGNIKTTQYLDWFTSPLISNGDTTLQYLTRSSELNRNFSNISWSIGYNYSPAKYSIKINIGKSFRMPIAKELAANGVNYHRFSYEVGDAELSPEISYQLDAGFEFNSNQIAIGTAPFLNYFTNYIYLNPTSEHDRLYGNGNQVFYYTQSKVFRYGVEVHAHYAILRDLQLGFIGEYIYSEQLSGEKEGYTLPFSPPPSVIFNLKYKKQEVLKWLKNFYATIDYILCATQNNIVPPEKVTLGYQLVNLRIGTEVFIRDQEFNISMQLRNLFNAKYFNHTSYYRLINVPEPGRNFIVNVSIPFIKKF